MAKLQTEKFINPFNASCSKLLLFEGPAPYWSNSSFLIFDIPALWRSVVSARALECQKNKNGGFEEYGKV